MNTLSFETGLKTFDVNGDPEKTITFNPGDFNFIHKLYSAYTKLDSLQKVYQLKAEKTESTEKLLKIVHEADLEIRKVIDGVFDCPASDMVFGSQSAYAITTDGCPLWTGFLVAVMANCDETFTERENAKNPKLEALMQKYGK